MIRLALVSLLVLVPIGAAAADSMPVAPGVPLTMPTPVGPKLSLPEVDPLTPPLMLEHSRPLQVPRSTSPRTLNAFPGEDPDVEEEEGDAAAGDEELPRLYLQHGP